MTHRETALHEARREVARREQARRHTASAEQQQRQNIFYR
jgi:hypothetical protein